MSQERSSNYYRNLKFTSTFFLAIFIAAAMTRYQKGESIFPSLFLIINTLNMIRIAIALENNARQRELAMQQDENLEEDNGASFRSRI